MSGMFKIFPGGFTAFFKTAFAFGFRGRPFLVPTRIPVPPMAFQPSVYFCISSMKIVLEIVPPQEESAFSNALGYGFPKKSHSRMSQMWSKRSLIFNLSRTLSACSFGEFVCIIFGISIDSRKGLKFLSSESSSVKGYHKSTV